MSQSVPAWLAPALNNVRAGHGKLTVAALVGEREFGRAGFSLASPAFADGAELDPCFTAQEEDAVAPPLEWNAPPPGTQELVIIVEDADSAKDGSDTPACHWLVWGLPAQKGKLLEGEVPPRVGKNALKNSEWLLPDPKSDDAAHDYVFQIYALDLPLTLMPGAGREELVAAMRGHVIGAAVLTGTYARHEVEDDAWDEEDI